jgi:hypothetical protein
MASGDRVSGVTDTLEVVAAVVREAVQGQGWQVHGTVPMQPQPPCIVCRPGRGEMGTVAGSYLTEVDLVCIAGGTDQPSALDTVTSMLEMLATALHDGLRKLPGYIPVTWDAPGAASISGSQHLAAVATITIPLLEPEVAP